MQLAGNIKVISIFATTLVLLQSGAAQSNLPALNIAASNDNATVSWPASAYYSILQSATDLAEPVVWTNLLTGSKVISSLPTFSRPPLYYEEGYASVATNIIGDEIIADFPVTNIQQFFRLRSPFYIPVFQFAIFYNGLLEFSTTATMTITGPVHGNAGIYVGAGASSTLTFNDTVTASGTVTAPANNGASWTTPDTYNSNNWRTVFHGNPVFVTNVPPLILPSGTNNPHFLIEMPPDGEDPNSAVSQMRLYSQAHVVLLVSNVTVNFSNSTVHLKVQLGSINQVPGQDTTPFKTNYSFASARTSIPFLTLTNRFYDQREDKTNIVTQIDVGKFNQWVTALTNYIIQNKFPANSGQYPTILYVADFRTNNPKQLSTVRIANGTTIVTNAGLGFTLATPNPLYVWGNYNAPILASTNTIEALPAALMSDALTILSANWVDPVSFVVSSTGPNAVTTTVNAAILTGNVPSTTNTAAGFSGGVHNLPRLLEDWTADELWLNTSIVCLYNSTRATNKFVTPGSGSYYTPPTRHFNFDVNFSGTTRLPPGTPAVNISWPGN